MVLGLAPCTKLFHSHRELREPLRRRSLRKNVRPNLLEDIHCSMGLLAVKQLAEEGRVQVC